MSLWKLCPTLDYTWSKNYELHVMSLKTETTLFLSPKQQSQKVLREMDREGILTFESDSREMPQSIPAAWAEMPESAPSDATSTPKSPQSIWKGEKSVSSQKMGE